MVSCSVTPPKMGHLGESSDILLPTDRRSVWTPVGNQRIPNNEWVGRMCCTPQYTAIVHQRGIHTMASSGIPLEQTSITGWSQDDPKGGYRWIWLEHAVHHLCIYSVPLDEYLTSSGWWINGGYFLSINSSYLPIGRPVGAPNITS